jgi:hypothetical protein
MDLCKLCKHEKDPYGIECETRVLVQVQCASLGVEVAIDMCNLFEAHEAFREVEEDE